MSFKFETITNEITLKVGQQNTFTDAARVTPLQFPKDFPIDDIREDGHCVISNRYKLFAERIKYLEVRSDDTWVVTYPKSGTTWTQELTWLLLNNLDFKKAKEVPLLLRFPFLEITSVAEIEALPDTIKMVEEMPSPRFIKSHFPIQFLPDQTWTVKPKIIYVTRNPKDVAVSFYHHYKILHRYTGTLEDFIDCYVQDEIFWSPVFPHMVNFCRAADNLDNILILSFEDMKKDLKRVIRTVAGFLNVIVSDEDVEKLADHLSFKNMRDNESLNFADFIESNLKILGSSAGTIENPKFIRKGKVGAWKDELSPELIGKLDAWIKRNEEKYPLCKKFGLSSKDYE